ncbi:MAG: TRAP transporter large permease, partial [Chloroflexota bacterium]
MGELLPILGLVEVVLLVILCLFGIHIYAVIGLLGCAFAILYLGDLRAINLIGVTVWEHGWSYMLTMVPLFILMGTLIAESGLGQDAYDAFSKWVGRMRGGLAAVSTLSCAAFGACTGSSASTIVAIGGISLPQMTRLGYSKAIRTGTIASASVLANLIPPSMAAILVTIFTGISLGKLFIAIVVPGLILMLLYIGTSVVWARLKPGSAPVPEERYSWKEKLFSLKLPVPIGVIFLIVIGGIYLGWFSPTEAGGIGASAVLLVMIVARRFSRTTFLRSLISALRLTGMIMFIIGGAFLVLYTIYMSRISDIVGALIAGWGLGPLAVVFLVAALFIIFGFALESIALVVLF